MLPSAGHEQLYAYSTGEFDYFCFQLPLISVRTGTPPMFPSSPPTPSHVVEEEMVARAVRESLQEAATAARLVHIKSVQKCVPRF